MGVGLGTMAGVGGAVGGAVNSAVNSAMNTVENENKKNDDMSQFRAKVEKLNIMKESGIISDEEFDKMKSQLLASIL